MIHTITFIEHGDLLIINHEFANALKENPKQILWINNWAYTIIPIEIVKKEVSRAKDVDTIQGSNLSSLFFHSVDAIEIPKSMNIDSSTAITNERLKDAVPFNIDYAELGRRMLANGAKLISKDYPQASPYAEKPFILPEHRIYRSPRGPRPAPKQKPIAEQPDVQRLISQVVNLQIKYKELEGAVKVCRDINDSGEEYSSPNADAAQALCNLFRIVDQ